MKKLKIFTEDMLSLGEIGKWRYKFRKFALPLLIALILAIGSCIWIGVEYREIKKDTNEIVNCISQASGEMSGDLEALRRRRQQRRRHQPGQHGRRRAVRGGLPVLARR